MSRQHEVTFPCELCDDDDVELTATIEPGSPRHDEDASAPYVDWLDGPCPHAAAFNASTLDATAMRQLEQAALRAWAEDCERDYEDDQSARYDRWRDA